MSKEIVIDPLGNEHEVVDFKDDYQGSKFGFWLFMFTELMMFGTLFLAFSIYFYRFSSDFVIESSKLSLTLGGTNTIILLLSAYTMGLTTLKMKKGDISGSVKMLLTTLLLSIIFLGIKAVEWSTEISHGIYPDSDILNAMKNGTIMFYGFYFVMTGLHGFHIIIGIFVMLWMLFMISSKDIRADHSIFMKNFTLYWDFVHLVWVFLFPLFYMIGA